MTDTQKSPPAPSLLPDATDELSLTKTGLKIAMTKIAAYEKRIADLEAAAPAPNMATRLVIVESPYAGDVEANVSYARAALRDCLDRGEAPYASHLLYTQPGILDDTDANQRLQGIEAGLAWGKLASATVVYTDRGISTGMQQGIDRAKAEGRAVEYRSIEKEAPA